MAQTTILPGYKRDYEQMVSALDHVLAQLPLSSLPVLVGELERLKTLALARIVGESVMTTAHEDDLLTMPEVARRLNISRYRAYELARQGILKPIRLGRSVRVKTRELTDYVLRRGH